VDGWLNIIEKAGEQGGRMLTILFYIYLVGGGAFAVKEVTDCHREQRRVISETECIVIGAARTVVWPVIVVAEAVIK